MFGEAGEPIGAGEDVHGERRTGRLQCGPERVVVRVVVRAGRIDVGGDHEATHATSTGALELVERGVDVGDGQAADAHETVRRDGAVVDDVVVVLGEHSACDVRVEPGEREHVLARVHHLTHDAID